MRVGDGRSLYRRWLLKETTHKPGADRKRFLVEGLEYREQAIRTCALRACSLSASLLALKGVNDRTYGMPRYRSRTIFHFNFSGT